MTKSKDKRPPPIGKLSNGKIVPLMQYDEEELLAYPDGMEFNLVARDSRSHPHHRLYWQVLKNIVTASGLWPTPEALHCALKVELGRVEPVFNLKGKVVGMRPDSTSFSAMGQREFRGFFDQAMELLAKQIGYDPITGET